MYAIIKIGANQYKIQKGDTLTVPRLKATEDKTISFDQVLMVADGDKISIGQPFLSAARVEAKLVRDISGKKTLAFKFRRRKNSKWKKGHRQEYTSLNIAEIAVSK